MFKKFQNEYVLQFLYSHNPLLVEKIDFDLVGISLYIAIGIGTGVKELSLLSSEVWTSKKYHAYKKKIKEKLAFIHGNNSKRNM